VYLAQKKIGKKTHFFIRESYQNGDIFLSRDLADLGTDPAKYIIYPGGNAFYVDSAIEECLAHLGVTCRGNDLEDIFWCFLKPDIQHALRYFRNRENRSRERPNPKGKPKKTEPPAHIFDRRRLHYLKFGRMEQGYLWRVPEKFFSILRNKSRDEIEQQFMNMERQLHPREYKAYAYVIFDIQKFFSESFADKKPQYLRQSDVDGHFVGQICWLNQDRTFWAGMQTGSSLHEYLVRYVVMYFDHDFAPGFRAADYIRDFINSRRDYHPPLAAAEATLQEASSIFSESKAVLKQMSRRQLVSLFRRRAQALHPDKGGDQEKFVRLTQAYQMLLKTKK
jgi:hypothetical protein